jgi:hypothetical protein
MKVIVHARIAAGIPGGKLDRPLRGQRDEQEESSGPKSLRRSFLVPEGQKFVAWGFNPR